MPGGPGLGSESLKNLTNILKRTSSCISGNFWNLDLPGDGSNTTPDMKASFQNWPLALLEAVQHFQHVILVAHSTGGMYALSTPELENYLEGLILLDSAPNATWQASFTEMVQNHPISELNVLHEKYRQQPTNELLKHMTQASSPYLFTKEGMKKGMKMLEGLPYNYEACQWSEEHFDQTYKAKWVPNKIPTLIVAGEKDLITPLTLFLNERKFHRKNIVFQSIKHAGHFPWIDNPREVLDAFQTFLISSRNT